MARQDETILICLDYLLNFTDEEHPTIANKICEYALDTYGVVIDHRSIKSFFERLKELADKYPDKFPFILESNGGQRPKYYIEQKYFSREDILSIASAIKDSFQIDAVASKELIENFVDVTTNVYQKEEILKIIENQPNKGGKIDRAIANQVRKIEQAINEKRRITYKFKYSKDSKEYTDYFYKIMYIDKDPIAIVIHDGKLVSWEVRVIKIIAIEDPWYDDPRCKWDIKDEYHGDYSSPEEETKDNKIPGPNDDGTYQTSTCSFKFPNTKYVVDALKESFSQFFNMPLTYVENEDGNCYAEVSNKANIILMWLTRYEVAQKVTVLGDSNILFCLEMHYKTTIHQNNLNRFKIEWEKEK